MQITVDLPDDIAGHADPGREALEALAIEGYRCGKLTHYQASQLLGMTRFEFDGFLKDRHIYDHAYGVEELEQELQAIRADPQQPVFVAERPDGRGLCGLLEVSIRTSAPECTTDRIGFLEGWYVDPEYRQSGIGGTQALLSVSENVHPNEYSVVA